MINLSTWVNPFGYNDVESKNLLSQLIRNDNALSIDNAMKQEFEKQYKKFLPKKLNAFMYGISGTQSIEFAIRIAKKITLKNKFLHYKGCYHGNSISLLPTIFHGDCDTSDCTFKEISPPYCYRCANKCNEEFNCIKKVFDDIGIENDFAGIIVDPAFGNIVCNPGVEYFDVLKKECEKRNIQLIFDEIRVGMGRTGHNFAFETLNVVPDILCISKALAGGIPLSLTIYDSNKISYNEIVNNNFHIDSTFAGLSIGLEMAKYTIERLNRQLNTHGLESIQYFKDRLETLKEYDCIGDIRSFGMIYAVEFINPKNGDYSVARAQKFIKKCIQKGIKTNGVRYESILLIHPYLNITKNEVDEVLSIFHESLN